jgi:hypothetical protein
MKKIVELFLLFAIATLLNASVSQELEDSFYEDDFEEIIRFDMLHFNGDNLLDEKSQKSLKAAVEKIEELRDTYR